MMTNAQAFAPSQLRSWWDQGITWDEYLNQEILEHRELWEGVYRKSSVPEPILARVEGLGRAWKLLAITEDWCGDASNLVPIFARLAETSPRVDLRVVRRDEHPDLMDQYLTNGSRSIPIIVILDDAYRPVGRWGPRPAELQEFVIREKRAGERPSAEIYRVARRWYAKDRGETTLREVVEVMASAL
jgi:hypothetical protein